MQRPILNPNLGIAEPDAPQSFPSRKRKRGVSQILSAGATRAWRVVRWTVRFLFSRPLTPRKTGFRNEDGSAVVRLCKGVAYRMLFAPILVALTAGAFVFSGTHPRPKPVEADPSSTGLYYDTVAFASADGTQLDGWIVPVVDAKQVVAHGAKMLRTKHPGVVLVHDFGQSPQQMLPYLKPLHEDGLVTLSVGLRGSSGGLVAGDRPGQTFGLRESDDVAAAVALLRQRPFVDPDRIAVLGIGTGATAALRAAAADPTLRVTVLIDPAQDVAGVVARRVGPQRLGLQWMQPICKWAFELSYRVDAEELALDAYKKTLENRPVLLLAREGDMSRAREALQLGLQDAKDREAAASAR